MRQTLTLVFLTFLLTAQPLRASNIPVSLSQGDEAFKQRASEERAREALSIYRQIYQEHPDNPEAAWRLSMACYFVGLRLSPDSERSKIFAQGREAGQAAISKKNDCAPCHFWTAINMALYGKEVGVFKMLFTLREIREHLKVSATLDPAYANGGAQRLLGAIEENLPGILGGSNDRARDYYEKATVIAPDEPLNFLFLARLLLKNEKTASEGINTARKGSLIPIPDLSRVESIEAQSELKTLLSKNDPGKT